jgi:prevent-host-death family protein
MTIKDQEMVINVAEAKSKFSNLLALAGMGKEEVVIAKRDKPIAVLISYEAFLKMKRQNRPAYNKEEIEALPSSLDRYAGIVSEEEIDKEYKKSREAHLREKYL